MRPFTVHLLAANAPHVLGCSVVIARIVDRMRKSRRLGGCLHCSNRSAAHKAEYPSTDKMATVSVP